MRAHHKTAEDSHLIFNHPFFFFFFLVLPSRLSFPLFGFSDERTLFGVRFEKGRAVEDTVPAFARSAFEGFAKNLSSDEAYFSAAFELLAAHAKRLEQCAQTQHLGVAAKNEAATLVTVGGSLELHYRLTGSLPFQVLDHRGSVVASSVFLTVSLPQALNKIK